MTYSTPVRDMRFALNYMADIGTLSSCEAYGEFDDTLTDAILEEIGKFCDGVLAPLNWDSDQNGAKLVDGVVHTTPGFDEAYRQYVEGGWPSLAFSDAIGGQGLPQTLALALVDAMNAACMSFAIGTTLTSGAAKAVAVAGDDAQKEIYLGKLVSGEWAGTMNLTESHAGSDLSILRAKAEPVGDGRYKISGQKIFITYGDHELTENVVHLVLARLPDAPEGTRGISMFLVPKYHVGADGSIGERNDVHCIKLEEKLGLHGSPTCVMAFGDNDACYGTLLGEENRGLQNMFIMMNSARLDVGIQGVGVAERAFQQALGYAQDRKQGRAPGAEGPGISEIYEHPDVRRMLYTMKACVEASRGICYANAVAYDLAHHSNDEEVRAKAKRREELLTPISKAWSTDRAIEVASLGVQVHGGMGYVEETGAAQHMRDARITAIYEGTNGIQAMDLVGRKVQGDGGMAAREFLDEVENVASQARNSDDVTIARIGNHLTEATAALTQSLDWILGNSSGAEDALGAATPFLKQFGNVAGGFYLVKGALAAQELPSYGSDEFLQAKTVIASHYADQFLTEAKILTAQVMAGVSSLTRLDPVAIQG